MATIHQSAVVHPDAKLGRNVRIGPFCVIQSNVTIGDQCELMSHVVIRNGVTLGRDNTIHEGAILGGEPQHLSAGPETGGLTIGDRNKIREHVTIHGGLNSGDDTILGSDNSIMINAHIGHDCRIGNGTILVNNVMLGGHVEVQDQANLSGAVAVHQFCRVGRNAMVGGKARITQDVPPFVLVDGSSSKIVGLNIIGLRRSGFRSSDIRQLKAAYRLIYRSNFSWKEIIDQLPRQFSDGPAAQFRPFFVSSERGHISERQASRRAIVRLLPAEEHVDDDDQSLDKAA